MLEQDGHEELVKRLASGKLEEDDIEALEEVRLKFSEKLTQSAKIEAMLTEDSVVAIARNHPSFAKLINLIGPKKAIAVVRSQLKEMCITDEARFAAIAEPIEALDSYRNGEYKKTNEKVEKFCKDNDISPEEYLKVLEIEDPKEKKKALKKLAKGQHGRFMAAINWIDGDYSDRLEGLKASEVSLTEAVEQLNTHQNTIGESLFYSVRGNEDMRESLARELLSESAPEEEPKVGFINAKKETAAAFDEKDFKKAWEDFKVKSGYATEDDMGQDAIKDLFIEDQQEEYREKNKESKGFWNYVLSSLFEEEISNKKDQLK
ncbi:MAG: hypothetical protein WA095_01085 [Minisyncoccia bacterium]